MWLKDDLEQLKQNWKQSPWWVRLWMVVSLFLAISSFASLSETFADWKGFFLDAIEFYRNWISGPLRDFAVAHGVRYTSQRADFLVLFAIITSVFVRALALDTDWSKKSDKWTFWLTSSFVVGGLCYAAYSSANQSAPMPSRMIVFMLIAWFILQGVSARKDRSSRLVLVQSAAVVVAVGILGAISTGLSASP